MSNLESGFHIPLLESQFESFTIAYERECRYTYVRVPQGSQMYYQSRILLQLVKSICAALGNVTVGVYVITNA